MPLVKWIDRIIDMSNTWLNACKRDSEFAYPDAIVFYINDAIESFKKGFLNRAGLSCSCAADCLVKMGDTVLEKKVYFIAAVLYRENANSASHRSTREWLWSLQKAYENFILGGEVSLAEKVRDEHAILSTRVQPFKETEHYGLKPEAIPHTIQTGGDLPEKVVSAVNLLEQEIEHLKYDTRTAEEKRNWWKEQIT